MSSNARSKSVVAILFQEDQPVAHATCALTASARNYPLSSNRKGGVNHKILVCKKFHGYVYGKQLTVVADHKPVEIIFNKILNINQAPVRLHKIWLTHVQ